MFKLESQRYGKGMVRVVKVTKEGNQDLVKEFTVQCLLDGDFDRSYTHGENTRVIPTDTVKNTIYVMAKKHSVNCIEEYGMFLAEHFLKSFSWVSRVEVKINQISWRRMSFNGRDHTHAFSDGGSEKRWMELVYSRAKGPVMRCGISDLLVLKTRESAFVGYHKDKYTTLQPATDRPLKTKIFAAWRVRNPKSANFDSMYNTARETALHDFAHVYSKSVQEVIWFVGRKVLAAESSMIDFHMSLPNIHNLTVDLAKFGEQNPNEVLYPLDEPHGVIEATVARSNSRL